MRILIVCDFLFKYGAQQARALAQIGHDVGMLCRSHALEFGGAEDERDEWIEGLRREGVRTLVVPGRVRAPAAVPRMLAIRRALHRWRPQVVHVHENHDPRLLALTTGYPTVLTVHDPLGHPDGSGAPTGSSSTDRHWLPNSSRSSATAESS